MELRKTKEKYISTIVMAFLLMMFGAYFVTFEEGVKNFIGGMIFMIIGLVILVRTTRDYEKEKYLSEELEWIK